MCNSTNPVSHVLLVLVAPTTKINKWQLVAVSSMGRESSPYTPQKGKFLFTFHRKRALIKPPKNLSTLRKKGL